jgi:glycosyltransferase involved in cell wall biosynthesis
MQQRAWRCPGSRFLLCRIASFAQTPARQFSWFSERCILARVNLSVVIITFNEEANIARTLKSVQPLVGNGKGEIIIVDSGSTDRTVEIATAFGAKVFIEEWKGYAAQKNSAIDKADGDWILSLDADESLGKGTASVILLLMSKPDGFTERELQNMTMAKGGASLDTVEMVMAYEEGFGVNSTKSAEIPLALSGYWFPRKNLFLGRWIKHGGFWPDPKLRLFRRGHGRFEARAVHEALKVDGYTARLKSGNIIHHSYPTLSDYIEHMNRYSSLGAEIVASKGKVRFSFTNIVLRPILTFIYNYFFRLGFLDGREGLLLHLYHAVYVSLKYAKAWELSCKPETRTPLSP